MDSGDEDLGPALGTLLEGRYELVAHLGAGGVGWVYRARHLRLGTDVAVKMLQESYDQHESLRPRFEREAKALAALRHPNIVSVTDYSVADGRPYLVMELLEGRTLADIVERGPLPEARARRVLGQVLDALIYAHGRGFAHRDLKPSNIFLVELPTDPDHVKILDFGFVKLLGASGKDDPSLTQSGIAFGTPSYMCPEQATGAATDPRADLYALGVVLFEMLAGRRPFVGEIPEVIRAHLTEPVPPLSVGGASIEAAPELAAFLERALAKSPRARFQTAAEMREALERLPTPCVRRAKPGRDTQGSGPAEPTRRATPAGLSARRRSSFGWTLALALGAVAAAIAFGGLAWVREPGAVVESDSDALDGVVEAPPEPAPPETPTSTRSERSEPAVEAPIAHAEAPLEAAAVEAPLEHAAEEPVEAVPVEAPRANAAEEPTEPVSAELEADAQARDELDVTLDMEPSDEEAVGAPQGSDEPAPAEPDPSERRRREDPWSARPAVPLLDAARRTLARGRPLSSRSEQAVRSYVRDHRSDARAHLVLAQHFLAKGYERSALERYELAFRVDPRARFDRRALPDLVQLASSATVSQPASALVQRVYGRSALGAVERALAARRLDRVRRARLEQLARRLRA